MGNLISLRRMRKRKKNIIKPVKKNAVILNDLDILEKQLKDLNKVNVAKPQTKNSLLLKDLDIMDIQLNQLKEDMAVLRKGELTGKIKEGS